jgi:hypothetical protein
MPAVESNPWYVLYFVPFIAFNIFIFIPINVAVIFDAFRQHRYQLVIKDRFKEREALFACFVCVDIPNTHKISFDQFANLMNNVYKNRVDKQKV